MNKNGNSREREKQSLHMFHSLDIQQHNIHCVSILFQILLRDIVKNKGLYFKIRFTHIILIKCYYYPYLIIRLINYASLFRESSIDSLTRSLMIRFVFFIWLSFAIYIEFALIPRRCSKIFTPRINQQLYVRLTSNACSKEVSMFSKVPLYTYRRH